MRWRTFVLIAAAAVMSAAVEAAEPQPAAARPVPTKRPRVVSDLSGFELLDPARLKEKPMVAGATRNVFTPPAPVLVAPHLAKLHGAGDLFAWRHPGQRFVFTLSDEAGKALHTAEVNGLQYNWPDTAPALVPGRTYTWSVKAADAKAPSASAEVVVLTKAERARVDAALAAVKNADGYTAALARAAVFVEHRIWYDALGSYSTLILRVPDRPEAYERRADLLAQIPALAEAAEEDFARAESLVTR